MSEKLPTRHHDRHFPVRHNLKQLKHQAKDLLRALRQGDAAAVAELRKHHPKQSQIEPATVNLPMRRLCWLTAMGCQAGRDW